MIALVILTSLAGGRIQSQSASIVRGAVPSGQPIYQSSEGVPVKVTTKSGYSYSWATEVLEPSGKRLGAVSFKIALPKGRTLANVERALIVIPPGGSAPLIATDACAEAGYACVALQSVSGGGDGMLLASQGIAVANHLLANNSKLIFVFSGFSMGGFGAQTAALHMADKCLGMLLIGNYYLNPPPGQRPVLMLMGVDDGVHMPYAEKALSEQVDIGTRIELMKAPGGHGYTTAKDQNRAFRRLLSLMK